MMVATINVIVLMLLKECIPARKGNIILILAVNTDINKIVDEYKIRPGPTWLPSCLASVKSTIDIQREKCKHSSAFIFDRIFLILGVSMTTI